MSRIISLLMLATALGGCKTAPAPSGYGSFNSDAVVAHDKKMAKDVAGKLSTLFPPAYNKLRMQHDTADMFGTTLVDSLRKNGYALAEFNGKAHSGTTAKTGAQSSDVTLAYVVDQPLDPGFVRVTLFINAQSLSRLYQAKDGDIAPVGYWVRKE